MKLRRFLACATLALGFSQGALANDSGVAVLFVKGIDPSDVPSPILEEPYGAKLVTITGPEMKKLASVLPLTDVVGGTSVTIRSGRWDLDIYCVPKYIPGAVDPEGANREEKCSIHLSKNPIGMGMSLDGGDSSLFYRTGNMEPGSTVTADTIELNEHLVGRTTKIKFYGGDIMEFVRALPIEVERWNEERHYLRIERDESTVIIACDPILGMRNGVEERYLPTAFDKPMCELTIQ